MRSFECSICGKRFETTGTRAKYCPECRIWKNREASANAKKAYRERRASRKIERTSINDVLRELDEYNKQHGTCYTYGQYMMVRAKEND